MNNNYRHAPGVFRLATAATLLLTCASATIAQDKGPQRGTTLAALYEAAALANPRSAVADALAGAAEARVSAASLPPDPTIQIGFMNYGIPDLRPMELLGMREIQVMQMIPLGKLRLSGDRASALAAAQRELAADVRWDVRSKVAMAFYEIHRIDETLALERETIRLLLDAAAIAEAMYRVGEGRQADVLQAQVEIARMSADTVKMLSMRKSMAARLNALLGRDAAFEAGALVPPRLPASIPALEQLVSMAQSHRPMIQAGERELAAATAASALARREIVPDFLIGVQYGQRETPMGTDHMGSLMVGASIPLFARSRQYRMRDEMRAMQSMAEADLASVRIETAARITELHAVLARERKLAALYHDEVVPQAEANVRSALAAYRSGNVDFMTLLDAQMALNRYREELLSFAATEGTAWAELEMFVGRDLFAASATDQRDQSTGDSR
jgi:outer membrane protein TolC